MATVEDLEQQIEELRARLDAVSKGGELKIGHRGFKIGNLRVYQREIASGDDRLYQEEPDGTQTDLTKYTDAEAVAAVKPQFLVDFGTEINGQAFTP